MQGIDKALQWIVAFLVGGIFVLLGVIALQVVSSSAPPPSVLPTPPPNSDQPNQPFVALPTSPPGGDANAPGDPAAAEAPTATPTPAVRRHIVVPGDTLYGIASQFGVSLDELIAANADRLPDPNRLDVGQELIIPSPSP